MKVTQVWLCPNCETDYESEYSANSCCKACEVWKCGQCKMKHDDENDAKECCIEVGGDDVQCLYCPAILTFQDIHDSQIVGSLMLCKEHRPAIGIAA